MNIKIRADKIVQGDVLPATIGTPRRVVARVTMDDTDRLLYVRPLVNSDVPAAPMAPQRHRQDDLVFVEVRNLTPAQERADELADLLAQMVAHMGKSMSNFDSDLWDRAHAILNDVRPKAPTLDEVLRALDSIDTDHMPKSASAILDRARRTGLL